jgi:hypothetical protein
MSLRSIHILFIIASIAMALVVAVWGIEMYTSGRGSTGHLAFGIGSALSGVGLAFYMTMFVKKTKALGIE